LRSRQLQGYNQIQPLRPFFSWFKQLLSTKERQGDRRVHRLHLRKQAYKRVGIRQRFTNMLLARLMALLLIFALPCYANTVATLDVASMRQMIVDHDKVVLLMHAGPCERAEEFVPTLEEIAKQIPSLPFGKIDVHSNPQFKVDNPKIFGSGVWPGVPALKALFRNAPPGKRVLEYQGAPNLDAVLAWSNAVNDWNGLELPPGWQDGRTEGPSLSSLKAKANPRRKGRPKDEV